LREVILGSGADFVAMAIVRGNRKILAPNGSSRLRAGDHLIVEIDPSALGDLLDSTGFGLAGRGTPGERDLKSEEIGLVEAIVLPRSRLQDRTAPEAQLRAVHGLNLLAVARQGARIGKVLKRIRFKPGDVLLIQGARPGMNETLSQLGLLPLAPRDFDLGGRRRVAIALGIFALALATLVLRLLPAQVAFSLAALAMVLSGLVSLRAAYRSIDWPVIVLLGAMIPVGGALESTGGAALIAGKLAGMAAHIPIPVTLGVVLLLAMFLSDVMNNAATAVIMAPISVSVAHSLGVSSDPFLMAVAVGASCAFLTPIGHQSNTLVMGPGGYRFGDYWRMGLPLEILIVLLAVPLLLWAWPL
jgi:di/tricarboxylate transporter